MGPFAALDARDLLQTSEQFITRCYRPGERVCTRGTEPGLIILIKGQVTRNGQTFSHLEVLGAAECLTGSRWDADPVAGWETMALASG